MFDKAQESLVVSQSREGLIVDNVGRQMKACMNGLLEGLDRQFTGSGRRQLLFSRRRLQIAT